MHSSPFFQVPRSNADTSEGPVALPILYYDATVVYAFFLVERPNVERILSGTGLWPGLRVGNQSVVGVACYEYRDTTVGVYNEVGIAATVSREGNMSALGSWIDLLRHLTVPEERHGGMYVIDLPVTTPQACAAGREIWGFPKFVTPIPFQFDGHRLDCRVQDPAGNGEIMCLSGHRGKALLPTSPFSLTLFSILEKQMLRTHVNARGKTWLSTPGDVRLTVGNSTHGMAQRLRDLGLDGAKPMALMWSTGFQSRLNAGCSI